MSIHRVSRPTAIAMTSGHERTGHLPSYTPEQAVYRLAIFYEATSSGEGGAGPAPATMEQSVAVPFD